jgi:pimeloyl-ACP methyl ester carboxylesterase
MRKYDNITYEYIKINGIQLHVAFCGSKQGEPVILLHGFPDASFGWDFQMEALAAQKFYVIAPDQRGYNLSDKPKGKRNYMMTLLVADIIALADALNLETFHLAGHDFGAMVCWNLIEHHAHRVKNLAIFNVPHPTIMTKFLKERKEQRRKSWYAFFFRIPFVPELALRARNWKSLTTTMRHSFSEEELQRYRTAWSQPGAIKAMVNWYRCMFSKNPEDKPTKRIKIPTLIVWGKKDVHLMWEMAGESAALCDNSRLEYLEKATHWVLQDDPENTSKFLIEHFSNKSTSLKEKK